MKRAFTFLVTAGFALCIARPCQSDDVYRLLVPLPRGIVQAEGAARVPVEMLASPEVSFGKVSGLVDGDIGCGAGAVAKEAPGDVADQAYRIVVSADGVKVVAGGAAGERYARVTLAQLAKLAEGGAVPAGEIVDWPDLKWRGVMNDCGRNFLDVEGVKAIVDLAARYKLNLFHWHLTEFHGWRLESKRYPNLTAPETMLRQKGRFYTQDDFRDVVAYAAERGITVMPELDVPGHSLALRKGLGVEFMKDPRVDRAVSELIDELCHLAPKEVMPFIHLGTDEVRISAERVDAGQCSRWAEVVARNGRVVVGWAPGEKMSSSGEIVDMVWRTGHHTNTTHRLIDAAGFYFGSLGPELILNRAQFAKACDWDVAPERKLGAIACCWHDDNVGEDTRRLFQNTAFAPALVALADNFWLGRQQASPQFFTRLPPNGSRDLDYTVLLENRILAQRDKVLKDFPMPFPYVRQTHQRWRVTDGAGRVLDGCYRGGLIDVNSLVTNKTGLVVAETWIHSDADRMVGAWIDFGRTATTGGRCFDRRPALGEWSSVGSTVEVNGEKVAPPEWRHPGVYSEYEKLPKEGKVWLFNGVPYSDSVSETPIANEWHFTRESTQIRLRRGWNHVKLSMFAEPFWRGTFLLLDGTSERPKDVKDVVFSSDPQSAATRQLRPFIRAWGVNLNKDGSCGTKFRIPVEEGHCYGAKAIPRVDGICRFLDASGLEYRRFRLSEQRRWFYPPPGATEVEVTLDSEARLEFWEDFEPPRVPVPHPDPLGYCDTTTNMPTDRFQREIDAAAAKGGGTVRVPSGVWHVKPIVLKSNVTLEFAKGAVLLASTDRGDYDPVPRRRAFIYAEDAENVAMRGEGVIDGRGYAFQETGDMSDGSSQPQTLPKLMCFNRCRNVSLEGFTYRRGGAWGCHLCNCYGVTMRRVKCFNHTNAMNDGIDIESCNVLIEDCDIDADDDAIAVKAESDKSFSVTNIVIRNCRLASMAYPFKIGTGSYSDVRDILVENCKFPRTKMNHRFAWSKIVAGITNDISGICGIGIQCVDGGRLENVTVRNVEVEGYGVPLAIRLGRRHEPPDGKATFLRNVLVENIDAIAEGPTASSIVGSKGLEIENVTLRNLKVRLAGGATALDVAPVCPNEKGYPGPNMFRSILPASGLFVQDARGVVLDSVDFSFARPDERPLVVGPVSETPKAMTTTVWLDELDLSEMTTGWGVAKKGKSIAGRPLTLGTTVYARGVGTHAQSELSVRLDGKAVAFDATVGVDRGAEKPGKKIAAVQFLVKAGGRILAESPVMSADDPPFAIHAELDGVEKVELVVSDAGAPDADHANWCDARFAMRDGALPVPVAPFDKMLGVISPAPGQAPRINGPAVYGVRPGHPIVYRVPVSGARPMKITADSLPDGVRFDASKGILSGSVAARGTYNLRFVAENAYGTSEREFSLVVGDRIALTPPMGWNSWNCFAHTVTDRNIRDAADALERTGLADHGWCYVNIDDFWQNRIGETDDATLKGPERNADGTIVANVRFPSMRDLTEYIHAKGFKAGIYSSPGPTTCGRCTGSWKHEWQDAKTYADWGFDYLKYDWCGYSKVVSQVGSGLAAQTLPYRLMGEALAAQGRDIVFSLCQYGRAEVSTWGANVGGHCWRTTQDITDTWSSMFDILQRQAELWPYAGPGAWNDPDMLVLGRLGWGEMRPSRLKPNEQYTHFSFWCILCSPLLIGCDLTQLDELTLSMLTNDEVLDTNQDELGAQAARVQGCDLAEVWAKPMSDGSLVFALLNKTTEIREVAVELEKLGVKGSWRVRDLWRRRDVGIWSRRIPREVYPRATELLRLYPADGDACLEPGLRDIRDNATYLHFSRARPVGKPGHSGVAGGQPCDDCPESRKRNQGKN